MTKRKYKPGRVIKSMNTLTSELTASKYVWMYNRPQHPGWVMSMQYRTVVLMVDRGAVRHAKPTEAA